MPGAATTPATNGHSTVPEPPTESHLAALHNLAVTECQEPVEVYEGRIRTTMKIPQQASVSPRLLTKTMSMATYMELFAHYRRLEAQLAKSRKEVTSGTAPQESPAAQPTAAAPEAPPAVPPSAAGSSSASATSPDDAAERDRVRLRAEVASWNLRISDKARAHVIVHNSYSRARQLLWKTRVDAPAATTIEAAAD